MQINKKKYYTAIGFLLLMIAAIVAATTFNFIDLGNPNTQDPSVTQAADDQQDPNITPGGDQNQTTPPVASVPTFTSGWAAYNYALDKMVNGAGYKYTQEQRIAINESIPVLGTITGTQTVTTTNYVNSQMTYCILNATCTISYGEFYNLYVTDQNGTVTEKKTDTNGNLISNKTTDSETYYQNVGAKPGSFLFAITPQTATLTSSTHSNGVYTISFTLKPAGWANYITSMNYNNPGCDADIHSCKVTLKISDKTGYFVSYEVDQNYSATKLNVPVIGSYRSNNIQATITGTFSIMNQDFTINI